jgi:hypothetical protein
MKLEYVYLKAFFLNEQFLKGWAEGSRQDCDRLKQKTVDIPFHPPEHPTLGGEARATYNLKTKSFESITYPLSLNATRTVYFGEDETLDKIWWFTPYIVHNGEAVAGFLQRIIESGVDPANIKIECGGMGTRIFYYSSKVID